MKYLITESQLDRAADKALTFLLEPHEEKENPKSKTKVWIKDGEKIALIYSGFFLLRTQIWDLFSEMFSLNYDETQSYIKKWLEEHYNLGELTPIDKIGSLSL